MAAVESKRIPKEILVQTNKWRITLTVAGTLLCAALLNLAAGRYLSSWSPNTGYVLIGAKWDILRELPVRVDLLILGDSGGNQGVDPEVFREKLGESSVNLCTIGDAMVLNDLWMLEAYLDRYGPPRHVVIVHGYDIWSRDVNISVLSQIPGSWWDRPPQLDLSLKQKIKILLNRHLPIYTQTTSLAHVLKNPWTAFRGGLKLEQDGFVIENEADSGRVTKDTRAHLRFISTQRHVISDLNRRALERIGELAQQNDFDVFVANGPLYDGLYANPSFQAYFVEVQSVIANITARYARMHYILNPPVTFPKADLQSADHLTRSGAVKFTARIADEITLRQQPSEPTE